ncbi:D-aminoacylase [Paraburkholderia nemoris]|uniref:N-acyl-D-amino-acid deacylase family protein n=1 Tax=Paraburkholderia nemoris TaxID=2793076 RepID=UPI0006B5F7E3|nr:MULTISPECIES: D-aminoacylase [Paraburkholderia]KPD20201.1 D-aminoacylase [Burkholderia sp. ST111]MBK5147705.1 D-aminoacylase [Burkholderia sp. R-69608]MBK3739474.1 D-aminoacylase [Paraburkholderia aspalathi]MBK3782608.1 D-aminoacylase [Paraburkholderia aspalathi]CAE6699978.1 D-aminoacylase [Paraburkholderia nemoris]
MNAFDTIIRGACLVDGTGAEPYVADLFVVDGKIAAIGACTGASANEEIQAHGLFLAPGFIDAHTHDDLHVINHPAMLPKISQGVTTVVVGNCGISGSPVRLSGEPPDPINLLGDTLDFRYPSFTAYVEAVNRAMPAVNVAALVGHTSLRSNHMTDLRRAATAAEIAAMKRELTDALRAGAMGLSTGLAYRNAQCAPTSEVEALAAALEDVGGLYVSHIRSEDDSILEALDEAVGIGLTANVEVVISHLKCAGRRNWGRSAEVLERIGSLQAGRRPGCDCYPYAASSTTLDPNLVDEAIEIRITWSTPWPDMAGRTLAEIARHWDIPQVDAARRLEPAGAIYHEMQESDVQRILAHPATMIGSDGLPNDPRPHPRLWGTFARVLGHYSRELNLFPIQEAVRKMTGLTAQRFGLKKRGELKPGYFADLVLFDAHRIADRATFEAPTRAARGIEAVWVNGTLSWRESAATGKRAGRFISHRSL